ncbi:hypothetical protein BGX24_001529 [Mortierella sp. AD032]|nr:hypothetical protein BGX24_001529 [Mortierella sp. AD032]
MTIEIVELESTIEAVDRKGLLDGTRTHTPTTSAGCEQSANDTDKPNVDVGVAMAKCQLTSAAGYTFGDDSAEGGRLMYWDDLPTWEGQRQSQSQSEGNVGR